MRSSPLFLPAPNLMFWAMRVPFSSVIAIGSMSSINSVASLSFGGGSKPFSYNFYSELAGDIIVLELFCYLPLVNGDIFLLAAWVGDLGFGDLIWFILSDISWPLAILAAEAVNGPVWSRRVLSAIFFGRFFELFSRFGRAMSISLFSSRGLILSSGFSNFCEYSDFLDFCDPPALLYGGPF